jgi:membrane associated rhomboid family serine protease
MVRVICPRRSRDYEFVMSLQPFKVSILRVMSVSAAAGFIVFFICIILIADLGQGKPWWSFIEKIPYGDKVGHLGLVGMLSFLCNLAFPSKKTGVLGSFVTRTTLVLLILLSLEELSQGFIKGRTLDFYDWLADLAGLAIGQFAAVWIHKQISDRKIKSPATTGP